MPVILGGALELLAVVLDLVEGVRLVVLLPDLHPLMDIPVASEQLVGLVAEEDLLSRGQLLFEDRIPGPGHQLTMFPGYCSLCTDLVPDVFHFNYDSPPIKD